MIPATDALARLREGNRRFVDGPARSVISADAFGDERAAGQTPFAIILSCSDSRVPPEIVFDQGIGDLFVIRVAGNVVEPSLIGSVEYAASVLGAKLIVVLGHSNCGAVTAALGELKDGPNITSPNLLAIVESIHPSISADQSLEQAISANVAGTVQQLQRESQVVRDLVASGDLTVIGAEYVIETGIVTYQE